MVPIEVETRHQVRGLRMGYEVVHPVASLGFVQLQVHHPNGNLWLPSRHHHVPMGRRETVVCLQL